MKLLAILGVTAATAYAQAANLGALSSDGSLTCSYTSETFDAATGALTRNCDAAQGGLQYDDTDVVNPDANGNISVGTTSGLYDLDNYNDRGYNTAFTEERRSINTNRVSGA